MCYNERSVYLYFTFKLFQFTILFFFYFLQFYSYGTTQDNFSVSHTSCLLSCTSLHPQLPRSPRLALRGLKQGIRDLRQALRGLRQAVKGLKQSLRDPRNATFFFSLSILLQTRRRSDGQQTKKNSQGVKQQTDMQTDRQTAH